MSYFSSTAWGPIVIPKVLKWLIAITCAVSIATVAIQDILDLLGIFPGPVSLLSLSWWGLKSGFLWEPLSFVLLQESAEGLELSFLFLLAFNMYILWVIGSNLIEVIGTHSFLGLYFFGSMIAGAISLLSMLITGQHGMLSGLQPALIVIASVWVMAFPKTEIFLFFLIPFKAKWLVAGAIGALCLINLVRLEFPHLILYIAATLVGYVYAATRWGWKSPFSATKKLDIWLAELGFKLRQNIPSWRNKNKPQQKKELNKDKNQDKIIDITSEQPFADDASFVDAMLAKISKYGESSLTWSEKQRLQKISEKKFQS